MKRESIPKSGRVGDTVYYIGRCGPIARTHVDPKNPRTRQRGIQPLQRRARWHVGLLQLDDHQRHSIDEADQMRLAGVERAGHAELADQQEIIVRRMLPINDANSLRLLPTAPGVLAGSQEVGATRGRAEYSLSVNRQLLSMGFCWISCSEARASEAELAMTNPARPLALSAQSKS